MKRGNVKKAISAILSLVMILSMMQGVLAAEVVYPTISDAEEFRIDGTLIWRGYWSSYDAVDQSTKVQRTKTVKRNGTYSGYLTTQSGKEGRHYNEQGTALTKGTSYTAEFYTYGNMPTDACAAVITRGTDWSGNGWNIQKIETGYASEADAGNWVKNTVTFTPTNDGTLYFGFVVKSALLVDDILVYATGDTSKTNMVKLGNFEDEEDEESKEVTYPTIEKDVNAWEYRVNSNLAWRGYWNNYNAVDQNSRVYGTNAIARSGEFSGYIPVASGLEARHYDSTATALTKGTSYTAEFYTYGDMADDSYAVVITKGTEWSTTGWNIQTIESGYTKTKDKNGWVKYTVVFTPTNDGTLYFGFKTKTAMFLDDILVYETSDSSKTNLIAEGDFENTPITIAVQEKEDAYVSANWGINKGTGYAGGNIFIEPTMKEASEGMYSMHFVFPTSMYGTGNNWIEIYEKDVTLAENVTKYDISMKVKGTTPKFLLYHNNTSISSADMAVSEADSDGWKTYTLTGVELEAAPRIRIWQATNFYIDEFVVAPTGTTTNIYSDGSFENINEPDLTPGNLIAYPVQAGGALNISWINSGNAKNVELFVDGTKKATFTDVESNSKGEYLVDNLTNGTDYDITVTATSSSGKKYSVSCVGSPAKSNQVTSLNGWNIVAQTESTGCYNDAVAGIVASTMNTTGNSLQIKANTDNDNGLFITQQDVKLSTDYGYQISFKAYTTGTVNIVPKLRDSATGEYSTMTEKTVTKENGYSTYVYQAELISKDTMEIGMLVSGMGTCQIDDVDVVTVEWGEVGTQNLFTNAGFDTAAYTIKHTFTSDGEKITSISKSGTITVETEISNNYMGDDFKLVEYVAVYDGNNLIYVAPSVEKEISETSDSLPGEKITIPVNIEDIDAGDYSVKVMIWSANELLKPYCNYAEISE